MDNEREGERDVAREHAKSRRPSTCIRLAHRVTDFHLKSQGRGLGRGNDMGCDLHKEVSVNRSCVHCT